MSRAHVILSLLVLVVACTADAPRYELDGLTVLTEDFGEVCSDSLPHFERRLAWLELETGLPRDPAGLVFHWYLNGAPSKTCSTGNCSVGRSFYGEWFAFSHELAHAHLDRLGTPRVWLSEGVAMMLEDRWGLDVDEYQTPSEMLKIEDASDLDYSNAGAFTAYLRDRYSMAELLEFYEASAGASAETSVEIFGDVFGESFADVEAEYLALDVFPRSGAPTCDALEVAWTGETWEHDFILACDEPGSLGPQQTWNDGDDDKGPGLFSEVTMAIPPGPVTFELAATEPVWITIIGCDQPEFVLLSPDELQAGADLLGGRYIVSATTYLDPVATATLSARRLAAGGVAGRSMIATQPIGPTRSQTHPCKARHATQPN
jgi:hypothetical protein